MSKCDTAALRESGQVRLVHGTGLAPEDRLSFVFLAGDAVRIAHSSVSLHPADRRHEHRRRTTVPPRDGHESNIWSRLCGPFWAERRAAAMIEFWEETPGREQILAAHTGYQRLPGRPVHRRRMRRSGQEWRVTDEISGRGARQIELRFHLPRAVIAADSEGARAAYGDGWRLRLRIAGWHSPEAAVEPGWYSPEGVATEPCPVLAYRWHTRLPFEIETIWEMGRAAGRTGEQQSMEAGMGDYRSLFAGRGRQEFEGDPARRRRITGTGLKVREPDGP